MELIDFHAHHPSLGGERVVQDGVDTRGCHPWKLLSEAGLAIISTHTEGPFLAVGESGLDRLCDTPYDLQLRVFREEVRRSEEMQKPLILHCVRAIDDVLRIRKEMHAGQPWIWHGFRGRAQQVVQLLPHGFYFSFGWQHHTDALRACPLDRLLLETDEDTEHPIALLYERVAQALDLPLENLVCQMHQNFNTLFQSAVSAIDFSQN